MLVALLSSTFSSADGEAIATLARTNRTLRGPLRASSSNLSTVAERLQGVMLDERQQEPSAGLQVPVGCSRTRFLLVDARAEKFSNQRFCLTHAMRLAAKLGRTFVAPVYTNGSIKSVLRHVDRDTLDYFDIFEQPSGLCTVRLRPFLASFPIARSADGKHAVAGANNFSLAEVVVMPESVEKAAQKVAAAHPSEVLLLLKERGHDNMCYKFGWVKSVRRDPLYTQLSQPSPYTRHFIEALRRAVPAIVGSRPFMAIHWRTITNDVMEVLMKNRSEAADAIVKRRQRRHPQQGGQSQSLTQHLNECAARLTHRVAELEGNVAGLSNGSSLAAAEHGGRPVATSVLFFSDLHASNTEVTSFTRMGGGPEASRRVRAGLTGTSDALQSKAGWHSGDELLERVLHSTVHVSNPPHSNPPGVAALEAVAAVSASASAAKSMYPILLSELLGRIAPILVTCTDAECSKCARSGSQIVKSIVSVRQQAGLPTVGSW